MWKPNRTGSHPIYDLALPEVALEHFAATGLAGWTHIFAQDQYMKILPTANTGNSVLLNQRVATISARQHTTNSWAIPVNSVMSIGIPINGQQNEPHYYTVNGSYSFENAGVGAVGVDFVIGRAGQDVFPNLNASDPPGVANGNINIMTSLNEIPADFQHESGHPVIQTSDNATHQTEGYHNGGISKTILEGAFHSAGSDNPYASVYALPVDMTDNWKSITYLSHSKSINTPKPS